MKILYTAVEVIVNFSLPLLGLIYVHNRYIIICCPQLIPKYCTYRSTTLLSFVVVVLGIFLSIDKWFNKSTIYQGFNTFGAGRFNAKSHEYFAGYITLSVYLVEFFGVFLSFLVLTKRLNATLEKTMYFLQSQDQKFQSRITSYKQLILFNTLLFFLSITAMVTSVCKMVVEELFILHLINTRNVFVNTFVEYTIVILDLLSSLEIGLFPLIIMFFLPIPKESFSRLIQTISPICCKFCRKSEVPNNLDHPRDPHHGINN